MKKWPRHEVIGLAAIAVVVAGVLAVFWIGSPRPMQGTTIHYQVDVFSGRVNPEWTEMTEQGGANVLDLFSTEPSSGVAVTVPSVLGFRGVVLTGDLPGGGTLDAIRVVPSGYYLEFADGTVRFVEDQAAWPPIRDKVEHELSPSLWNSLLESGEV